LQCSKDAYYLPHLKASLQDDPNWITWSLNNFANLDLHSKSIAALIYVTRKRDIGVIFKPTPLKDQDGKLEGIIGNIFNQKSAPAFTKIDGDEIGSCFAIQQHSKIPPNFSPKIVLKANIIKDAEWEFAEHNIPLCVVPILASIPFGKNIESISFDDSFIEEMSSSSVEHGFWDKLMSNIIEQAKTDSKVNTIVKRPVESSNKQDHDPCRVATKGFRTNTFLDLAPFIYTSILGTKFPAKQAFLKEFFVQYPTPNCVKEIPNKDNDCVLKIPVVSNRATAAQPPFEHEQQEFFNLMVKTMQKMQHAPLQGQTKIVIESRDHKETVNTAKLQNSMVRHVYTMAKPSIGIMIPSNPSPLLLLLRSTKIYLSVPFLSRSRSLRIYSGLFFPLKR
jgi:hypothetical protein